MRKLDEYDDLMLKVECQTLCIMMMLDECCLNPVHNECTITEYLIYNALGLPLINITGINYIHNNLSILASYEALLPLSILR